MPDPQASSQAPKRSKLLQNDEWLALIVAFGTIGGVMAYSLMRDQPEGIASLLGLRDRSQVSAPGMMTGSDSDDSDNSDDSDRASFPKRDAQSATQRLTQETDATVQRFGGLLGSSGLMVLDASRSRATALDAARNSGAANRQADSGADPAETIDAEEATREAGLPEVAAGSASVATDLEATSVPVPFSDLAADRWSKPFIDELSKRKLISGFPDGTFAPDRPVTRAELAAQIQQIFERDTDLRDLIVFTDVSGEYWGRAAIDKSVEIGFLNGYPNAVFAPDQSVSRLEVAIALATGLGLNPSEAPEAVLAIFPDAETIPGWARPKIAAATQAGFAVVDPDLQQFDPNTAATREVVAVMMYQALVWAEQAEPIASDRLVRP